MKLPHVLTIIILATGSFWGLHEHQNLTILREQHRQVLQEAASLGVSADLTKPFTPTKAGMHPREDAGRKAKDFVNTLVAFTKEMKDMDKSGKQLDEAMQKRMTDVMDGILSLKRDELKILIAELRGRTDMDDEMGKNMIGSLMLMLAQQHPETALAILTESSDLLDDNSISTLALHVAFSQWAKDQPLAALEWIKNNAEKHSDLVTETAKGAVIASAAQKDYGLAFQLAGELKLSLIDDSIFPQMVQYANTPERQAEFLAALRKQAAGMADKAEGEKLIKSGVRDLFSKVAASGYDKAMEWMKSASLGPDETANLADGLDYFTTKADTGKWLDWISTQPAEGKNPENSTRNLVRNWTEQDYKAAGEWLARTPTGPLKETATLSYLETVALYDPDVAAQWAETLSGDKQTSALNHIRDTLKQKDKTAAEDFAKRHGLESP